MMTKFLENQSKFGFRHHLRLRAGSKFKGDTYWTISGINKLKLIALIAIGSVNLKKLIKYLNKVEKINKLTHTWKKSKIKSQS